MVETGRNPTDAATLKDNECLTIMQQNMKMAGDQAN